MNGTRVPILDAIVAHWLQSPEGRETELYGYALHVEVVGTRDGRRVEHVLTHTHPRSDGTRKGWEKLRAYTRCVAIPLAIGTRLILEGKVKSTGTVTPEAAFDPAVVFEELKKREILVHEKIREL